MNLKNKKKNHSEYVGGAENLSWRRFMWETWVEKRVHYKIWLKWDKIVLKQQEKIFYKKEKKTLTLH